MARVFYIKRGDRGPSLRGTLYGDNTQVIPLTDAASVKFLMASTTPIDAAAVIEDAAGGVVRYDWVAGNTDEVGVWNAEFEITWNDGRKQTVPSKDYLKVFISEDLG